MRDHLIGIMAMIMGFIAIAIKNYAGAYVCFGFAFILWCVLAIYEYRNSKKESKTMVAYICDEKKCESCPTGDARYCYHTLDIKHAANFEEVEPGRYIEKE